MPKSKKAPTTKPKKSKKLSDHTVIELKKMAKKAGVKLTNKEGKAKNKRGLIVSLSKK
jgi:hypothetical protein